MTAPLRGGVRAQATVLAFKPSHYSRDKDGAPNTVAAPLSADADRGDQEQVVVSGVYPTLRSHQRNNSNLTTEASAIVLRNREGKPGGGKGPLLSEERSLTLASANDQVLFTMASGQANAEIVRDGSPSLTAQHDGPPIAFPGVGIPRRLMPIETERLQGWPDNHTAIGIDEQGERYALSDTARYRLCGNGIASPVIAWIGLRLRAAAEVA